MAPGAEAAEVDKGLRPGVAGASLAPVMAAMAVTVRPVVPVVAVRAVMVALLTGFTVTRAKSISTTSTWFSRRRAWAVARLVYRASLAPVSKWWAAIRRPMSDRATSAGASAHSSTRPWSSNFKSVYPANPRARPRWSKALTGTFANEYGPDRPVGLPLRETPRSPSMSRGSLWEREPVGFSAETG